MKRAIWFKIISLVLVAAFLSLDIAWAYPADKGGPASHNLAAQSVFSEDTMTADSKARRGDVLLEAELAGSIISIATALFHDRIPLYLLDPTLGGELKKLPEGMDLSEVTAAAIKDGDLVPLSLAEKDPIPADCIAIVPYNINGKDYIIQITRKDNPSVSLLAGKAWPISDLYEVRVNSGGYEKARADMLEKQGSAPSEPAVRKEEIPPAEDLPRSPERPGSTALYSFDISVLLGILSMLFDEVKGLMAEHPYVTAGIAAGIGITLGIRIGRSIYRKREAKQKRISEVTRPQERVPVIAPRHADPDIRTVLAPEQKTALVIGAGRIGRGLIGKLLNDSGYEITFVNRGSEIVDILNKGKMAGGYNLDIVGKDKRVIHKRIDKVTAIKKHQKDAITAAIRNTNVIFVAVFDQDFEDVSSMIARGMEERLHPKDPRNPPVKKPLNIIVVSNRFTAKHVIRDAILRSTDPMMRSEADALLGIVDTATFNIIPDVPEQLAKSDPALIQIYEEAQLEADSGGFRGEPPKISGMNLRTSDKIREIKLRKLFVYNGAHAICAYLGRLKGHKLIHEAANDPAVREVLNAAFNEIRGLMMDWPDYDEFIGMVMQGLADPRYNDDIDRVAKDPIRKLASFDRLVNPAKLILRNGRMPHAYATGIAAALLYDNPDDPQAQDIQAKLAKDKGFNDVIRNVCGLEYDHDGKLIGLIAEKLEMVRKEKAKAELAFCMKKGYEGEERYYDKTIQVAGKLPRKVKLVVWDFDNVVGNTQKFYSGATATVYWRIIKGIKEADAMPSDADPIYKKGIELYYSSLKNGPATFLTIKAAMDLVRREGRGSELLSEVEYYKQFRALRESMFSVLEPSDFFHPGVRELLCTIRALNPDAEFCINTALEEGFFERQFMKSGFRGYFNFAKALTEEQRNAGSPEKAKAENLKRLIKERGVDESEVVIIDDSSKFMDIISDSPVFKIGVATNIASGMELIDKGVNSVFMNMKPTREKLKLFGVEEWKAGTIENIASDVYMIRSSPEKPNEPGKIDPSIEDIIRRDAEIPVVSTPEMRKKLEEAFEYRVRTGAIKPNVIVNIKDFSPNAVAVYMAELKKISEYYNGNVTFVLVVESNINMFRNDMPSTFTAIAKARDAIGNGFDKRYTMVIADGGRKIRNMPLTLLYLYEGLMPYSYIKDRVRLHEVFVRTGGLMMQMPEYGAKHVAVVASDSVFNSENISMHDGRPLSSSSRGMVLVPEVEINVKDPADPKELSTKIVRAADPDEKDRTRYVLANPGVDLAKRYESRYKNSVFYGLHFLTIWRKAGLNYFLKKMQDGKELMDNGKPFLQIPCDMFMLFFQSVFMPEGEWLRLRPANVTEKDWKKARRLSIEIFGKDLDRVEFPRMDAKKAFTDEGILKTSLPRFSELVSDEANIVKKSPEVQLSNATGTSLDHVVIRGKGRIIFGRDVKLKDVIIELSGETLSIPDKWTIKNAYLKGDCVFEGSNSYLEDGLPPAQPSYLLQGISAGKDGHHMEPIKGRVFPENTVSTIVSTLNGKQVTVTVPINASREALGKLKFDGRDLFGLQVDTDICANRKKTAELKESIEKELAGRPGVFPIDKAAVSQEAVKVRYSTALQKIVGHITEGSSASPGKQYWVTIEGIQGAGKTHMISDLRKALGNRVVVIEEDWYHLSREQRNEQVRSLTDMGIKTRVHHAESWHNWKKLRKDIEKIRAVGAGSGKIVLENLYNRDKGGTLTRTEELDIAPDTIFIYSGFYVSDKGKVDIPADCSIYIGINQEDSLSVKLGRDRWRTPQDIYALDNTIYRPAFEQYIATYDPAASADIVLSYDNVRDRSMVNMVTPESRHRYEQEKENIARRGHDAAVHSKTVKIKKLREMEFETTSIKARFERAWVSTIELLQENGLLHEDWLSKDYGKDVEFDRKTPSAAMKTMAQKLIAAVSAIDKAKVPPQVNDNIAYMTSRLDRLEPDSITASLIVRARKAKREGKKFIIGIETDWIPGFDDKSSLQRNTTSSLIKGIEAITAVLHALNLENSVEVVHSSSGALARDIMARVGGNTSDLSNVLVLASTKTVDSPDFQVLKSTATEPRAFIAAVDTADLDKWYGENKYSTEQPDIKLVEMLSIALELSIGNTSYPASQLPLVLEYKPGQRMIVFLPKAVPVDINELRKRYDLQLELLRRMA